MAGPALSQNQMKQERTAAKDDHVSTFDFRTPNKFPNGFVRELVEVHKGFGRMLSDNLTRELRAPVVVEAIGSEQLSYDAYIRSMPNPSILSIVALNPLPGQIVLEMSTQLGLILVDRMLGGPGRPIAPRQPTQLEQTLLGAILEYPLTALKETYEGVVEVTPEFVTSELNPSFAHAASPTEMVLVLTFSVVVDSSGPATRGLISLCYPLTILNPIKDAMRQARWSSGSMREPGHETAMSALLEQAAVDVAVHTSRTRLRASNLIGLQPGDVVMLDHAVDEPFTASIEGLPFMRVALGRQGAELAARLENWT
jgi:flagellar motor switch protein FliM